MCYFPGATFSALTPALLSPHQFNPLEWQELVLEDWTFPYMPSYIPSVLTHLHDVHNIVLLFFFFIFQKIPGENIPVVRHCTENQKYAHWSNDEVSIIYA